MDPISSKVALAAAGAAGEEALYVDDVFSTFLYEGTGSSQTITNGIDLAGEGGLVWIKGRDGTASPDNLLFDTERGATKLLTSNGTGGEISQLQTLTAFTNSGFTLGTYVYVNSDGSSPWPTNYASWSFRKAPGFFDVVTYTGDGTSSRNIAHNLGSVPGMIIVKRVNDIDNWQVYHRELDSASQYLNLNTSDPAATSNARWNSTDPTSSVFTVGSQNNGVGTTFVAYLFAHDDQSFGTNSDESIIKCGSYTGTGSSGNAINLGFEPQWVMIKRTSSADGWMMFDIMRGMPVDNTDPHIRADLSSVESSAADYIDPTPTGFTIKATGGSVNLSGDTYVYIAIRRPHKPPEAGTDVLAVEPYSGSTTTAFQADFPPDLAFIKNKDTANTSWFWADRLRGTNALSSNNSNAEAFATAYNVQFRGAFSDSWTDYIGWMFKRAPGFFDVVAYSGNQAQDRQVPHNLSVAPEMMIIKSRDSAYYWVVYHKDIGATHELRLPNIDGKFTTNSWSENDTEPTSSYFVIGNTNVVNDASDNFIAYLFATLPGISKVGSYSGSASAIDVDCGFTNGARFVLIKRTDTTGNWTLFDTERGILSGNDPYLRLNNQDAQDNSFDAIDPLASGFTVNSGNGNYNTSGGSYIFLAIA